MINKFKIFESVGKIPRKRINGIYYHGFSISKDGETELFDCFNFGFSDWEAIWVTEDETIAEEFSSWKSDEDDDIRVVYEVNVKSSGIADIDYETSQEISDYWGISDFRESINILKDKGYNGWCLPGSIDGHMYDDIALFYPNDQTKISRVKLFINDDWTDYMDMYQAQQQIDDFYETQ